MNPVLTRAALLGLGGGLRSFAVPAVLAARGAGPFPGPGRFIAFGAAVGEVIADKQPDMISRWAVRGLSLRLGFCVSAGFDLSGVDGAVCAGLAALASARTGSLLRASVTGGDSADARRAGLWAAWIEDALSYALVLAASRGD